MKFAIAVGRFYEDLAERLVAGAQGAFEEAGVGEADVFDVPGAFELPLAASYLAETGRYAGIACLGAVIRGETDHYDYVCAEAARGIMDVQLHTGVPCAFGVLTVENMEQALARTGGGKRDQGAHAAEAVVTLARLKALAGLTRASEAMRRIAALAGDRASGLADLTRRTPRLSCRCARRLAARRLGGAQSSPACPRRRACRQLLATSPLLLSPNSLRRRSRAGIAASDWPSAVSAAPRSNSA